MVRLDCAGRQDPDCMRVNREEVCALVMVIVLRARHECVFVGHKGDTHGNNDHINRRYVQNGARHVREPRPSAPGSRRAARRERGVEQHARAARCAWWSGQFNEEGGVTAGCELVRVCGELAD